MDDTCLSDRTQAWRRVLSPWIAALWDRLHIDLQQMPQRHDLERNLWIRFKPDDKSDNRDAWLLWLEAFELLDILSTRDSRVCWDILLDLCNYKTHMNWACCPQDLFFGLRPRYETTYEFRTLYFPREGVAELISSGITDKDHTPEYAVAKSELLSLAGPRSRSPIQLRWNFPVYMSNLTDKVEMARYRGRLNHILALATVATSTRTEGPAPCFEIASVGLPIALHHTNEAREIVHRIGSVIPIQSMVLTEPPEVDQYKANFYGPFLWRIFAPQRSRRTHLGIQIITIALVGVLREANVAAVSTAIAHSHTLRDVVFHGSNEAWVTWLAFALFSRTATHAIDKVNLMFTPSSAPKYLEALREVIGHANPVGYMAAVQDGNGVAKRLIRNAPTIVRVNAQTPIYVADHLRSAKTVYHGKQDAVCHVVDNDGGEFVRVLIPSVGFGRVHRKHVVAEEPTPTRATHSVRSLTLTFSHGDVEYFSAFLELIGGPLVSLTLDMSYYYDAKPLRLTNILKHCPMLKHLTLRSLKVQAETLLPSKWAPHLESLTLHSCKIVTSSPGYNLFVTPRMAPQLGSFSMDRFCVGEGLDLQAFARELLSTGRLARFQLQCSRQGDAALTQLVAHYNGQRIPGLSLRVKLAALSVFGSDKRFTLCNEIIAHIFALMAAPVQQRCCVVSPS